MFYKLSPAAHLVDIGIYRYQLSEQQETVFFLHIYENVIQKWLVDNPNEGFIGVNLIRII